MRMSQARASSRPPPRARPLIAATTGSFWDSSREKSAWPRATIWGAWARSSVASSLRSAPALKYCPSPVRTRHRDAGSAAIASNAPARSASSRVLRALTGGCRKVRTSTPSSSVFRPTSGSSDIALPFVHLPRIVKGATLGHGRRYLRPPARAPVARRDLVILSMYQLLANNRSGLFLVAAKGASVPVALAFVSVAYVAASLLGPVAGRLSDRMGRRRPFLLAAEIGAFPLFLSIPYLPTYWESGTMFLVAQIVLSIGSPALNAYVADLTGAGERGAGF